VIAKLPTAPADVGLYSCGGNTVEAAKGRFPAI